MINNIISMDYFKANLENIENIKDKKLSNAILNLVKFQSGNYLLDDSNTFKINSVSVHTVFAFNKALMKDIANSYTELEKSLIEVMQSEYRDLIVDQPTISGHSIEIKNNKDGILSVYDKKLVGEVFDVFGTDGTYIDEEGVFTRSTYSTHSSLERNTNYRLDLADKENGNGSHVLATRNRMFGSLGLLEYEVIDKDTKETKAKFLGDNIFKVTTSKVMYGSDTAKGPVKIDLSPRGIFTDRAFEGLTNLNKYKFQIMTNNLEKFTYGYLTRETNYIASQTKTRITSSHNKEYSSSVHKGREEFDGLKEDIEVFRSQIEYLLQVKQKEELTKEDFAAIMSSDRKSDVFQNLMGDIVSRRVSNNESYSLEEINNMLNETNSFFENLNSFLEKKMQFEVTKEIISNIKTRSFQYMSDSEKLLELQKLIDILEEYKFDTSELKEIANIERVSEISNDSFVSSKEVLENGINDVFNKDLENEYPLHKKILDSSNVKINNMIEYLNKYYYIDYSISNYTKIKENESNIKETNDIDEINNLLKSYISRTRASIYDTKVDSFVLNPDYAIGKFQSKQTYYKI